MSKNKVGKIIILLLVLWLVVFQTYRVSAMGQNLGEILSPSGESSAGALNGTGTNDVNGTNTDLINGLGGDTQLGNTNTNPTTPTSGLTGASGTTNTNINTNTSLPKTGTNENIIIGLMVICTLAGVYAFKKVKDYNM